MIVAHMTKEEHDILIENNKMLKIILEHILKEDREDFITNVLANLVSEQLLNKN